MQNRRKSEPKESREFSAEEEARRQNESCFSFIITLFELRINPRLAVLIFPFSVYKTQLESC